MALILEDPVGLKHVNFHWIFSSNERMVQKDQKTQNLKSELPLVIHTTYMYRVYFKPTS